MKTYTALAFAAFLSGFGAWIDFLAILTLASYEFSATPTQMAWISTLMLLPSIMLSPKVGRWIDRRNPQVILLMSLTLRVLMTLCLLLASSYFEFCLFLILRFIAVVPNQPCGNALVAALVPTELTEKYFALLSSINGASKILAPVLGALVASVFGESLSIGLSSGLTVCSMALYLVLFTTANRITVNSTSKKDVPEFSYDSSSPPSDDAYSSPLFVSLLALLMIETLMLFMINNQLPVLLRDAAYDKALLGVLVASAGLGSLLGGPLLMRMKATNAFVDIANLSFIRKVTWLSALCFVLLGVAFWLPKPFVYLMSTLLFFCTGVLGVFHASAVNTLIIKEFTNTAEVTAMVQSWQSAAMLIAPWMAAYVIPHVSLSHLFLLDGGMAILLIGLMGVLCTPKSIQRFQVFQNKS